MAKTEASRAKKIFAILEKAYPDARIMLNFKNPLELLIATILAAQCTDERVNQVTPILFRKYRSARDFAKADPGELEAIIRPTGFFHAKARAIINCCQRLVQTFGGKVPETMEELTTLPGVGRKTANVVLGNAFGIPGIVVDTHVRRVSQRLGLTRSDDPDRIEEDLSKLIPKSRWVRASHVFTFHGRRTCTARNPRCPECPVEALCPWPGKEKR